MESDRIADLDRTEEEISSEDASFTIQAWDPSSPGFERSDIVFNCPPNCVSVYTIVFYLNKHLLTIFGSGKNRIADPPTNQRPYA